MRSLLDPVDLADRLAVGTDHLHMFGHLAEQLALGLALAAPGREFAVEARLVLAAEFLIVAVELVDLAAAPLRIIGVVAVGDVELAFPKVALGEVALRSAALEIAAHSPGRPKSSPKPDRAPPRPV